MFKLNASAEHCSHLLAFHPSLLCITQPRPHWRVLFTTVSRKFVYKFQTIWRKKKCLPTNPRLLWTDVTFLRSSQLTAFEVWRKRGEGRAYYKKKKKKRKQLDLESYISSLKRRSLQGLLSKIKRKLPRSLSHVIFESIFFCSVTLVIFLIKGLSQTQHMYK